MKKKYFSTAGAMIAMVAVRFIVVIMLFVVFSCFPSYTVTYTLHKSLINETEKHLHYIVETYDGTKAVASTGLDSVSIIFHKITEIESEVRLFPLMEDHQYPSIYEIRESLYNLTDTSKYITPMQDLSDEDWIFIRHRSFTGGDTDKRDAVAYSNFHFTDSIVQIMKKDYTMLEKFSEYYQK